ncbi:MAG: DUF697 domain-containing protein [Pseudomonadota bacterium]
MLDGDETARELRAENLIKGYVVATVAASAVPVPVLDLAASLAIQLRMIQRLSQLYGHSFSERAARNTISALGGSVLGVGAGYTLGMSFAKIIPGVGWMIGMATVPVVAGASTYAIGRVVMAHFEGGGTLSSLNAKNMRAYYNEQFEKGKAIAAKAAQAAKATENGENAEPAAAAA